MAGPSRCGESGSGSERAWQLECDEQRVACAPVQGAPLAFGISSPAQSCGPPDGPGDQLAGVGVTLELECCAVLPRTGTAHRRTRQEVPRGSPASPSPHGRARDSNHSKRRQRGPLRRRWVPPGRNETGRADEARGSQLVAGSRHRVHRHRQHVVSPLRGDVEPGITSRSLAHQSLALHDPPACHRRPSCVGGHHWLPGCGQPCH